MEDTKQISKPTTVGDAAVEGLIYGIVAGVAMMGLIALVETFAGIAPPTALGYFDSGGSGSPWVGVFTHVAVSGMYGLIFGVVTTLGACGLGTRLTLGRWLALGILYGALLFGIAEWIVLPRTNSPLAELPLWAFAAAHFIYGALLGGLCARRQA